MNSSVIGLVAVVISGLIGYLIIGRIVDTVLTRLAISVTNLNTSAFLLNTVKPACVTLSIFGFGTFIMHILHTGTTISTVGFVFLFFLTCHACLVGRFVLRSVVQASISMVVVIAVIITMFFPW
jgi:hypothetical protein